MQHRVTQAVKAVIDMQKCREELGAILTCLVRVKFGESLSIWSSNSKADTGGRNNNMTKDGIKKYMTPQGVDNRKREEIVLFPKGKRSRLFRVQG